MKLPDLAELAVRNLRESILRNSLTTIGISVGVASLVAMLSLGIGLQQLASRRLMKSGLFDTVVVTSRRDLRNFGRGWSARVAASAHCRIPDDCRSCCWSGGAALVAARRRPAECLVDLRRRPRPVRFGCLWQQASADAAARQSRRERFAV